MFEEENVNIDSANQPPRTTLPVWLDAHTRLSARIRRLHPRPTHTASGTAQWPRQLWRKSNVPFPAVLLSRAQVCGFSALPQRRIFTKALGLSSAWLLSTLWSLDGGTFGRQYGKSNSAMCPIQWQRRRTW